MLHQFLSAHRDDLIERCRSKVALRRAPKATDAELEHGVPHFLDQLIKTLRVEQTAQPLCSREVSGGAGGEGSILSEIGASAAQHGRELLQRGFTVDQVVHNYGDLCQAITDLAFERDAPFAVDEFRTLNRCLNNAIADSVAEYSHERDILLADSGAKAPNERLGFLAHELRNLIQNATLAVSTIKAGNVGLAGATGAVLDRSLIGLRNLVDRSLADVRVTAGMPVRREPISLAAFIAEVKIAASLEAQARGCGLDVRSVDPGLVVEGDRELLFSALGNVLQNAFKFTHEHTEVVVRTYARGERVLIEVEDACGGLPPGDAERMFLPFSQSAPDKSGLGLGLSISRRSIEACGGALTVRNRPGEGCVFTIELRDIPDKTCFPLCASAQCEREAYNPAMGPTARERHNYLLAGLAAADFERLHGSLEAVELKLGASIYEAGVEIRHLYFPSSGIVSLLQVMEDGRSAELAVVGNEGVVGIAMFMGGGGVTPSRAIVQSASRGYKLASDVLHREFARGGDFQHLLLRYTQALVVQMAQTAVCNRHHSVEQQLCRWLLMSLDRLTSSELVMTQEMIANMLGVRREGVTEAAGNLQRRKMIRYSRGRISVLDRTKLEKCVCECYAVVKNEYDRLLSEKLIPHQRIWGV